MLPIDLPGIFRCHHIMTFIDSKFEYTVFVFFLSQATWKNEVVDGPKRPRTPNLRMAAALSVQSGALRDGKLSKARNHTFYQLCCLKFPAYPLLASKQHTLCFFGTRGLQHKLFPNHADWKPLMKRSCTRTTPSSALASAHKLASHI